MVVKIYKISVLYLFVVLGKTKLQNYCYCPVIFPSIFFLFFYAVIICHHKLNITELWQWIFVFLYASMPLIKHLLLNYKSIKLKDGNCLKLLVFMRTLDQWIKELNYGELEGNNFIVIQWVGFWFMNWLKWNGKHKNFNGSKLNLWALEKEAPMKF